MLPAVRNNVRAEPRLLTRTAHNRLALLYDARI